jgi:hypothetical protein
MEQIRKFKALFDNFKHEYAHKIPMNEWVIISGNLLGKGVQVWIDNKGGILAMGYGVHYSSDTSLISIPTTCVSLDAIYDLCASDINGWYAQNPQQFNDVVQGKISKLEAELEQLKSQLQ